MATATNKDFTHSDHAVITAKKLDDGTVLLTVSERLNKRSFEVRLSSEEFDAFVNTSSSSFAPIATQARQMQAPVPVFAESDNAFVDVVDPVTDNRTLAEKIADLNKAKTE